MSHLSIGISAAIWAALGDSITSLNYADIPYWKVISNANNIITMVFRGFVQQCEKDTTGQCVQDMRT
ncbi:hypothetical protein [Bacillus mycoides]|uniref:hypothetical protein n=1 Tax=Bacillus mycoides TaxID=1405 RepID=UPI0013FE35B9|nr:hypothetical protein [Bacillus mycoides]